MDEREPSADDVAAEYAAGHAADLDPSAHDPRYRRKLLWLLSVATFFEGYDTFVLALVLAPILADLGGTESQAGVVRAITSVGAVLGFLLAAQADRIGRKRLLLITIIGYTAGTFLTAVSVNLLWLTIAQFVAQIFLGAEWAVAVTIVVEEFPREHRGRALGIVTSMNTLGGISVGLVAFVLGLFSFGGSFFEWRIFYVLGIIPLIMVAIGRRGMRETRRYAAVRASETGAALDHSNIWEPWHAVYRRNVLAVGLMHFFRFAAVSAGAFWWPYYAQQEVGMSLSLTGIYLAIAGLLGAVGFLVAGRLIDRIGRRPTFLLYMALAGVFGVVLFQTFDPLLMLPILCAAIFFGLGSACITSAFSTELFPTYVRSRAAAWCRNAFEIPGGIVGPLIVGVLGDHRTGPIGSIGDAMSFLFIVCIVPVLFIAWRYIPETKGIDLDVMDREVAA
jgi:MFS transporter, putative metabolite:H+ symporter